MEGLCDQAVCLGIGTFCVSPGHGKIIKWALNWKAVTHDRAALIEADDVEEILASIDAHRDNGRD